MTKTPKFVEVSPDLVADLIRFPTVSGDMTRLFIDSAIEQLVQACGNDGKIGAIIKAIVDFPGPFMCVRTKRRSFYFAWKETNAHAIAISRQDYPRANRITRSVAVMPVGEASGTADNVRKMLVDKLGPENIH
jgi:hypothetical protein